MNEVFYEPKLQLHFSECLEQNLKRMQKILKKIGTAWQRFFVICNGFYE